MSVRKYEIYGEMCRGDGEFLAWDDNIITTNHSPSWPSAQDWTSRTDYVEKTCMNCANKSPLHST